MCLFSDSNVFGSFSVLGFFQLVLYFMDAHGFPVLMSVVCPDWCVSTCFSLFGTWLIGFGSSFFRVLICSVTSLALLGKFSLFPRFGVRLPFHGLKLIVLYLRSEHLGASPRLYRTCDLCILPFDVLSYPLVRVFLCDICCGSGFKSCLREGFVLVSPRRCGARFHDLAFVYLFTV